MHKESFLNQKKDVAKWMRRLYKKGLTTSLGGNISMRLDDNHIAITASGTDKGRIKSSGIAIVSMDGEQIDGDQVISMETGMHLSVYSARNDVNAIVHAHAPMGSLFAVVSRGVNTSLLAEAYTILGRPKLAAYAAPGSSELAMNVAKVAMDTNVVLMANHGVLAVGHNLLEAFDRIEVLENAAKMTFLTSLINEKTELTTEHLVELKRLFG